MSGLRHSPFSAILPSASMNWPLFHLRRERRPRLPHLRTPPSDAILYVILYAWLRVDPGPCQRANAPSLVQLCLNCQPTVWTWPQTHLTSHGFPPTIASVAILLPGPLASTPFGASPARAPCPLPTAGRQPVPQSITTRAFRRLFYQLVSAVAAAASVAPPRPAGEPPTPPPATCLTWARCAWRPSSTATLRRSIVRVARHLLAPGTSARLPATGVKADMTSTRPRSTKARFLFAPTPSAASKRSFVSVSSAPDASSPFTYPCMYSHLCDPLLSDLHTLHPSISFHIFPVTIICSLLIPLCEKVTNSKQRRIPGRWKRHLWRRNLCLYKMCILNMLPSLHIDVQKALDCSVVTF